MKKVKKLLLILLAALVLSGAAFGIYTADYYRMDETAAAVGRDGRQVLSSVIASQIPLHAMYGGVVPEIASRKHVESVDPVVREALAKAELSLDQVDAVAVTYGPGLVGALLVGVSFAKALAYAAEKPLIPVNHIEGHVSANYIATPDLTPPFVCLIASGGHSHIVRVEDYGKYTLLGQTMDDAAGEAFDKAARVLNLPYPGGPLLDKLSKEGNPMALKMPHVKISNVLLAVTLALMIVYFYITARYEQHSTTKKLKTAVPVSVLSGAAFSAVMLNTQKKMTKQVKTDISSSSGSGSRGGGGFGGGGGGGGGGGSSGSHRF